MSCSNCGEEKVKCKGLCARCYMRMQRHGTPELLVKDKEPCYGCGNEKVHAKGLCGSCYSRLLSNGSPEKTRPKGKTVAECDFCGERKTMAAHGLCKKCYKRARDHGGDPNYIDKNLPPKIRPCKNCSETREIVGKGYCAPCYQRLWKKGTLEYAPKRYRKFCLIEGCDKPVVSYGFCGTHRIAKRDKRSQQDYHLKKKFGMGSGEYEKLLESQGGVCAICGNKETRPDHNNGKPRRLAVDHNHKTGKVRSLLCSNCNIAIGLLGDSTDTIKSAMEYLEAHKNQLNP